MCKWSMMQSAGQSRRDSDAALIAAHIAEKGVTRIERGRRTATNAEINAAVRD